MSDNQLVLARPALSQYQQFVKAGYYGDVGTAKTSNLAAMARLGPGKVIYVDAEAGLEIDPLSDLGIPVERIIPFTEITYDALDDLFWNCRAALESDPQSITGIAFDSMSEIVATLVETNNDAEIGRQIKKLERRGEDVSHLSKFKIDLSSWGMVTEQVRRLIRHYRDLPCHLGWAALERRDVDQSDGKVSYGPKVNPGLQGDITAYVGIVLHTWTDGEHDDGSEVFVASTRRTSKYVAKDRFHRTPKRLAVPSFDRVVEYVNGSLTVDTDDVQQRYHSLLRKRRDNAYRSPEVQDQLAREQDQKQPQQPGKKGTHAET